MLKELTAILVVWLRWLRLRRACRWALRGLAAGLGLSLVSSLVVLASANLLRGEFLGVVAVLSLGSMALAAVLAFSWPIAPIEAARTFDHACRLDERISTAVELSQVDAFAQQEIVRLQLADALEAARRVRPGQMLPVRLKASEGLLVLLFVLLLGMVWFRGETWFQAAQQARAVQAAVEAQTSAVEELLAGVEDDPALSPEQAQALSRPLQEALQGLADNPSLEGSVSALVSAGESLQALSDPQAQAMAQALRAAGEQLAAQPGGPLDAAGEALASGETLAAAMQLAQLDPGSLNQAEAGQAASQLQALASALASTNPELASRLQEAAQALQNGDAAAAQAAIEQAAGSLADTGGQLNFSQRAQQLAGALQQGAGQVIAAGGGGEQASAGGSQPGQPQDGTEGGGSGSGLAAGVSPSSGSESGNEPIPQDNLPGNGGESTYEGIYAPELLGGEGGPLVGLPGAGEEGALVGESPSPPGEPGASLVPYDEVYQYYEQFNRETIEQGEIPVQFIPIIRVYFDSLRP